MGGTQRVAKWAKYFLRLGWEVTIITVKPIAYYAFDDSLLDELKGARIVRTASLDPARLLYIFNRKNERRAGGKEGSIPPSPNWANKRKAGLYWFLIPDARILWIPFAWWSAWREVRQHDIQFVVTSGPPHSAHFVGWLLAKIAGVKWVSDFRDSWLQGNLLPTPTALHRWLQRLMEKRILQDAHAVTATSQLLADKLAVTGQRQTGTAHFLPNGYDAEDFTEPVAASDHCFDVAYIGAISRFADPQTLLEGYRLFVETAQLPPTATRLHFIGADVTGQLTHWIKQNKLADYVVCSGYLAHREAITAMRRVDLLVYLVRPGSFEALIPGKTFEYLAAGKPVLAIGDCIEGMRLLMQHTTFRHCAFDAIDEIRCALLAFYQEFFRGASMPVSSPPLEFSREWQAQKLAAILTNLTLQS
ncbi:MAG: hypothetical protein ALAOOOJD_00894 [bacterium]|nr:hypothetical protein [bacterium]